jgi:acetyl esterase/lipase
VRLGSLTEGGLAPAVLAVVERGVSRRPALAAAVRAEVQLEFAEGYPPVRVMFAHDHVLVEDGPAAAPDLRVSGALADLVSLMMTPHLGGLPNPIAARGRAALGMVVFRRVRIRGRLGLLRRLLHLIAV